ncbi:MAG: heparinase II/III family protein, partial [Beijerinckiaceae bacterium]
MPNLPADRPWIAAHLRVQRLWRAARGGAAGAVQTASGLFGAKPTRVVIAPQDLRTADPSITADLYAGHYVFAGKAVHCGGESPFSVTSPSHDWTRALYGFAWLRHLKAAETPIARALAQALVEDFLRLRPVPREAMQAAIVARRAISWMAASPFLLDGVDSATYRRFMRALVQHGARLRVAAIRENDPLTRLECAIALLHVGLSIDKSDDIVATGISLTVRELAQQIGGDGGHLSRDPGVLVNLLLDMLPLRQCFLVRGLEPPAPIIAAIDRMMAMIRHMRHADGAIALFNGAGYVPRDVLATLIAYDDVSIAPETGLDGGYARLAVRDAVVIADVGDAPPIAHAARAHAGALAFEFSADGRRWIVNCGATTGSDSPLSDLTRATAAHSAAVLHDTSSARFMNDGTARRLVANGPVEARISVAGLAVEASQDGYRQRYGVTHTRRLTLAPEGDRLDGVDSFTGDIPAGDDDLAIRFHIHPAMEATLAADRSFVELTARSGHAWRLYAHGLPLQLEESIFLGGGDRA